MSVVAAAVLVHGYTMSGVARLSDFAVRKTGRVADTIGYVEAREEAWHGIVELLYLSPERPSEWSLTEAGAAAIQERFRRDLRDHGLRQNKRDGGGYEDAPRFRAYWSPDDVLRGSNGTTGWVKLVGAKPDWTDALVEKMALPQAMATLTVGQYAAVMAYAAFMTHADEEENSTALARTAEWLGIDYAAAKHRIQAARKRMNAVWYEHETAPGAAARPAPSPSERKVYDALTAFPVGASSKALREAADIPVGTFQKAVKSLKDRGCLVNLGTDQQPLYAHTQIPLDIKVTDTRAKCRYGHVRAEHGYQNRAGSWACRICLRNAQRRRQAKGIRYDGTTDELLEIVEEQPEPLTFAPARELAEGETPTGADVCWCGLAFGHDWPHKEQGAPHPRAA